MRISMGTFLVFQIVLFGPRFGGRGQFKTLDLTERFRFVLSRAPGVPVVPITRHFLFKNNILASETLTIWIRPSFPG